MRLSNLGCAPTVKAQRDDPAAHPDLCWHSAAATADCLMLSVV